MLSKREEGRTGEDEAEKILKRKGYRILERNFRTRFGEIDIVAEDKDCLVFVEVKKRNTRAFGNPFHAVNRQKRQHLVKSALLYMKSHDAFNKRVRFDVVGIEEGSVKVIRNAFMMEE